MIVTLYTTLGCHLCEQAHAMLLHLSANGWALEIDTVEIADDDDLIEKYGIRIPVLKTGGQELGWPFSLEELQVFLTAE